MPASEMFPPAPESAALPSASAAVGNPPPESPPPQESEERSGDASLTRKVMAWKLPMNGASEGVAMMGADSWPALAESAAMGRSKPSSSKIPSPSGSFPDPSSSPSLVPVHQKPNPNPTPVKTGDGVSVSSIDIPANAAPAAPQPTALKKRNPVGLGVVSECSPNDLSQCESNRDRSQNASFVPRNRSKDGHHGRYDGNRRAHNGDRDSNSGGHVKRQDHDRRWSLPPRTNMLQPMHRGYFRPSIQAPRPVAARSPAPPIPAWPPFLSMEAHSRPLVVPVGLLEAPPVYYAPPPPRESLRNAPLIAHQAPAKVVQPVDHVRVMLLKQIEYYFSNENLYKDVFLKKNMDDQGWIPISLIASFNRVKQLTNNIPLILEALRDSTLVEIQGEKVRRRNDWMNWILPSLPKQYAIFPELQPSGTTAHIDMSTS